MKARALVDPLPDDLEAEALDWFVRNGRGLTPAEQAAFDSWLAGDPARGPALARWQADWQALDRLPAAGVDQLRLQLASDKLAARPSAPPPRAGWLRFLDRVVSLVPQAAMAAFVLSVSGGTYLAWDHWQQQPVFAQTFATAQGQQLDVELPDGSRLRLDTATRVEVTLYRQRREVRLPEGQAVFQVQGDAARPFDVLAGPVRVTVVGTRFAVRNTPGVPGDEGVRVTVEEGHVQVAGSAPASAASAVRQLTAGQQLVADSAGHLGPVSELAAASFAPWRDGRITFNDTPLAQALAELERYGRTGLLVRDAQVAALRLTGTFDPRRPGNFMLALPKVLPVKLVPSDGSTEVAPAP